MSLSLQLSEPQARLAQSKLDTLQSCLKAIGSVLVAFSGGVDSSFLAFVAHGTLGEHALAVTAASPSLAKSELEDATKFAARFGIVHRTVSTRELENNDYVQNGPSRCYFCKSVLMEALEAIKLEIGWQADILLGVNVDDLGDYRPGQRAIEEHGGRSPLVDAGLTKLEIRWLSRELGIPTWDKPAAACLSSRIAYGTPVTAPILRRIEKSEAAIRDMGLSGQIRVRDQGSGLARIEVDADNFGWIMEHRRDITGALKATGFSYVTLDLEGYRQGSHNVRLTRRERVTRPQRAAC